jgi:hypothetical protein
MKTATLTLFAGGHAAFLEQPEAFVAGFEAFVASLDIPPAALRPSPPPRGLAPVASIHLARRRSLAQAIVSRVETVAPWRPMD